MCTITYGLVVVFEFVEDIIGYLMRPRAQQYGTVVFVPRPQLQVYVTIGFNVKFRTPRDFTVVVYGDFRFGKYTRHRIQGAEKGNRQRCQWFFINSYT